MGEVYTLLRFETDFDKLFVWPVDQCVAGHISLNDATRKNQVKYLKRYVKRLGADWILVENDYIDRDFLTDFAAYYVSCFTPYSRRCRRAHFFRCNLSELASPGALQKRIVEWDHDWIRLMEDNYLGFVVLRPLPDAVLGKVVLKTWDCDSGKRIFSATRSYDVNLFGLPLEIESSLAAQEQDTVLAACATSALWSAFHQLATEHHLYVPTPAEITKSATRYLQTERPIPTTGLIVEQICNAILEAGLTPEVYNVNENTSLNSLMYAYVAGGIPVLLGYRPPNTDEYHAVTVCGYRLEDRAVFNREAIDSLKDYVSVGRRISEFYVHDDNLGPFSRLECQNIESQYSDGTPLNPRAFLRHHDYDEQRPPDQFIPSLTIVPVYHKIRIRFSAVQRVVFIVDTYFKKIEVKLAEDGTEWNAEWDVRLSTLKKFRNWIRKNEKIAHSDKCQLISQPMPKYLWLATASVDSKPAFTMCLDATDMERSFFISHLVSHNPALVQRVRSAMNAHDSKLMLAQSTELPYSFCEFLKRTFVDG